MMDDLDPDPRELVRELREAVGLFAGALPYSPKQAWDEAIEKVVAMRQASLTHWRGCWRAHHECAVILLDRILSSDSWAAECEEFGCAEPDPLVGDGTALRQAMEHLEHRRRGADG